VCQGTTSVVPQNRVRPFNDVCALCAALRQDYHDAVDEKKLFWVILITLSLIADFALPLIWGLLATIPILFFSWWVVYRSGWIG
jgi:uncharacterized membrane protein